MHIYIYHVIIYFHIKLLNRYKMENCYTLDKSLKLIIIDGLIGAGKSILLKKLKKSKILKKWNIIFILEPLETYRLYFSRTEKVYFNPLKSQYERNSGDSLCAQIYFMDKLKDLYLNIINVNRNNDTIIISERYVISSLAFISTLHESEMLNSFSYHYVRDYIENSIRLLSKYIHIIKIFYLSTDINSCIERIYTRARNEETDFKHMANYLNLLNKHYMKLYSNWDYLTLKKDYKITEIEETITNILKE